VHGVCIRERAELLSRRADLLTLDSAPPTIAPAPFRLISSTPARLDTRGPRPESGGQERRQPCRVGKFELRNTRHWVVLGAGIVLMSVMLARGFGRFHGGL